MCVCVRERERERERERLTSIEKELDHFQVSLVAGESECALFELTRVCVDVGPIVQQ